MPVSNNNNNHNNENNTKNNNNSNNQNQDKIHNQEQHQQQDHSVPQEQHEQQKQEQQQIKKFKSFDDMPLVLPLLRGIYSFGFEKPSEIQQTAIVPISKGGDVIAQNCAGTGKTGAFVIGSLARLNPALLRTQILFLSPTRELAKQSYEVTLGIGQYLLADLLDSGASPVALLSSNIPVRDNITMLQQTSSKGNAQVVVGTPGRILQLFEKGALRPEHLKTLVLDECDELFAQNFQNQIAGIFRFLPRDIQIVLVSATLPNEVRELSEKFMRSPTRILLEPEEVPVESIRQFTIDSLDDSKNGSDETKMLVLFDLYERISIAQSIIFVNSRRRADFVAHEMNRQGFTVSVIHGELSREEREAVFAKFKRGESRVLVSTDLTGRGIDVYHVNLVINYEMPLQADKYIHRVGRCGRYGRKGAAINLLSGQDVPMMKEIERTFGIKTSPLPMNFTSLVN